MMPGTDRLLPRSAALSPAAATFWADIMGIHGPSSKGMETMPARLKNPLLVGPGQSVVNVTPDPRSSKDSESEKDRT